MEKNEDLALDNDALKNIILEGEFSNTIKERMAKMGLFNECREPNKRSATLIGRAIKSLNEEIKEDDFLENNLEKQFIDTLESLISGKV